MTIKHARVAVTNTATQLDTQNNTGLYNGDSVIIQNLGTASVYLGGTGVTTSSYGYELQVNNSLAIDLRDNEPIYGIVTAGTITVNVLTAGA